jgi:hypothetical protein
MPHPKLSQKTQTSTFRQLELDFASVISDAWAEPEQADVLLIWDRMKDSLLEGEHCGLSDRDRLEIAAQAMLDLSGICLKRAELSWEDWMDRHNTEGPIPDDDFLAGVVQQSMYLDISALVKQPKKRKRWYEPEHEDTESLVEEVSKEMALLLAGAESEDLIAELEHDEHITAWAAIVRGWMCERGVNSVSIGEVICGTKLSAVKVWLAGLLSDFDLDRDSKKDKDFYNFDGLSLNLEAVLRHGVA